MSTDARLPEDKTVDRVVLAKMNTMYLRTSAAPWKKEKLLELGMPERDADFVIMIHARFPDVRNSLLALVTYKEMKEAERESVDPGDFNVPIETLEKKPKKTAKKG